MTADEFPLANGRRGENREHRDIKPANILLDQAGCPVVADFGLALRDEEFGTGPTSLGTLANMSPEQARGEGHLVDARSDVYSLGVVFYELLTGRRPFPGPTDSALRAQIIALEAVTRNHRCGSMEELLGLTFDWLQLRRHFSVDCSVHEDHN